MAKNEVAKKEAASVSASEKFTTYALREFGSQVAGEVGMTDYQRTLIQGYFIGIDRSLKMAEENRIRKNESNTDKKWNNDLPINWNTVNLKELVLDVVHYAKIGLDMMQPNHLSAIPFKNRKTKQYDVAFIKGYIGIQYIAEKYALNKPKNVITELVYSTDAFKPVKKNVNNSIESYEFEIANPFDRGNVVGGFGYIEYDNPEDNKLIIMTMKDIEKRKPKNAAAEFWGGKTTEWRGGKKVEVTTDGWFEEMCMKTLKRYVYNHIEIDPKKIDDNYQYMKLQELHYVDIETKALIDEQANTEEFILPEEPAAEPVETEPETVNGEVIETPDDKKADNKKAVNDEKASDTNEDPDWVKGVIKK